jgi:hypothetical protein
MKKYILLCIMFFLITGNSYSQLKHFLPHSNAYLSILDKKYWFEGDTIINEKRYTKVYQQFCYSETDWDPNRYYYAAVREDTIAGKIYALFPCDNTLLVFYPDYCSPSSSGCLFYCIL